MDRTEGEVLEAIADYLGQPLKVVRGHARLREDLGLDSLDHVELTMAIEEEEGIAIPDEEAEGWRTVQDIVDTVKRAAAAGGGW